MENNLSKENRQNPTGGSLVKILKKNVKRQNSIKTKRKTSKRGGEKRKIALMIVIDGVMMSCVFHENQIDKTFCSFMAW